jgi:hypothetical protein
MKEDNTVDLSRPLSHPAGFDLCQAGAPAGSHFSGRGASESLIIAHFATAPAYRTANTGTVYDDEMRG